MRAIFALSLICFIACGLPGAALAQGAAEINVKPIGRVVTVTGQATAEHSSAVVMQASLTGGPQALKVDDPIYLNDVIQTAADAVLGMVFTDGTSFSVSKNARMEINEFIYEPKGKSNSTLFNLTKGTFTFIAGKAAASGNMRVETPVGTMGIRGTAPHVEIMDGGKVKFATLIEGNKRKIRVDTGGKNDSGSPRAATGKAGKLDKVLQICRGC